MTSIHATLRIERDAPIPTWFGVGGRADRLAHPETIDDVRACMEIDPGALVLGEGANLIVDDDGVDHLVITFRSESFAQIRLNTDEATAFAGAGVGLPKLINACVRAGLAGPEALGGVPGTVGGAIRMNAGGRFGEIGELVGSVHVVARDGSSAVLGPDDLAFGYRRSGLEDAIITGAELSLTRGEPAELRERLLEIMRYKKQSQPLRDNSAGCCFKNPVLAQDLDGIGGRGTRVPAGLLIDRAGCKGLAIGGAVVSMHHANFIVTRPSASARDVIDLMDEVACRVREVFGVQLEREVVVWNRGP